MFVHKLNYDLCNLNERGFHKDQTLKNNFVLLEGGHQHYERTLYSHQPLKRFGVSLYLSTCCWETWHCQVGRVCFVILGMGLVS